MDNHLTRYLVCYDICDPKRLRRVHRLIRDWGLPIQFSIFEIEVNKIQLNRVIKELTALMDIAEDKVIFYRLVPDQDRICLGVATVDANDILFL